MTPWQVSEEIWRRLQDKYVINNRDLKIFIFFTEFDQIEKIIKEKQTYKQNLIFSISELQIPLKVSQRNDSQVPRT